MTRTIARRIAAGIALAAVTAALAGCGIKNAVEDKVDDAVANATEQAQDAVNDAVNDALSSASADVDLGLDGEASIPDTFPSELPLPDGKATVAFADASSWTISFNVDSKDAYDDLVKKFEGDGSFGSTQHAEADGSVWDTFSSDKYDVTLVYTVTNDQASVLYGATAKN